MSKPVVTEEMVETAMVSMFGIFDDTDNCQAWVSPRIDEAKQKVRAALEAAISASPAEPVGYVPASGMADLQAGGCTWLVKPMSIEGVEEDYIPVFASPQPPVEWTDQMQALAGFLQRLEGLDAKNTAIFNAALAEYRARYQAEHTAISALGRKP